MSINSIMNNALSSLNANQQALRTTSSNIANINTPDYARRTVHFGTVAIEGLLGGVRIEDVERVVDKYLQKEMLSTTAAAASYATQEDYYDRLQAYLGDPNGDDTLSAAYDRALAALTSLSADPTSTPRRIDALSELERLTDSVAQLANDVQSLRADANTRIDERVDEANRLIREIAELNPRIVASRSLGQDPGALDDQRDSAVQKLSELMELTIEETDTGALNISTTSGIGIVSQSYVELQYDGPTYVDTATTFPNITLHRVNPSTGVADASGTNITHLFGGGEIHGLLEVRDRILPTFGQELGGFAAGLADAMNAVHNDSISVPPQNTLEGRNTGLVDADDHGFSGTTWLAVVANDGSLVRKVEIDFTAGTVAVDGGAATAIGGTTMGDLETALNTALAGVGTVDFSGGTLTVDATNASHGIGFLDDATSPSDRAGRGFSHFFGLNDLLTARQSSITETGFAATDAHRFAAGGEIEMNLHDTEGRLLGSVTYTMVAGETFQDVINGLNSTATGFGSYGNFAMDGNGRISFTPNNAQTGAILTVVGDSTDRAGTGVTVSDLFGIGSAFAMQQAKDLAVNPTVANDADLLATAKLDLDATTAVGDIVASESDNRGALALEAVDNDQRAFNAIGSMAATNATVGDYLSSMLANVSVKAAGTQALAESAAALNNEALDRKASVEGVNLDEEFTNLTIYQKSYNAAARLITAAREMYDALLSLV